MAKAASRQGQGQGQGSLRSAAAIWLQYSMATGGRAARKSPVNQAAGPLQVTLLSPKGMCAQEQFDFGVSLQPQSAVAACGPVMTAAGEVVATMQHTTTRSCPWARAIPANCSAPSLCPVATASNSFKPVYNNAMNQLSDLLSLPPKSASAGGTHWAPPAVLKSCCTPGVRRRRHRAPTRPGRSLRLRCRTRRACAAAPTTIREGTLRHPCLLVGAIFKDVKALLLIVGAVEEVPINKAS